MNEILEKVSAVVKNITGIDVFAASEEMKGSRNIPKKEATHIYRYFVVRSCNLSFKEVGDILKLKDKTALKNSWEYVYYNQHIDSKLKRTIKQIEEALGWADR